MTTSSAEVLRGSIEGLYDAFSEYHLRERIEACSHCHGAQDHRLLQSKGLRELGVDELHHYIWDAMKTWGDDYDFRHFLPRILEIYAFDKRLTNEVMNPAIVLANLRYGNWKEWPAREQRAVRLYLSALWELKLNHDFPWQDYSGSFIEDWICAVGQAEDDMAPYLAQWESAGSPTALGNLSHFIVSVEKEIAEGKLRNAFWDRIPIQATQVVSWLHGDAVRQKLSLASAGHQPPNTAKWIKRACTTLKLLA